MAAALMPAKRGNSYQFDPNELVIVGLDTKDGPEHELWDERIKLPLDETMVVNIMAVGVKETVLLRHNKALNRYEVIDGRGRVRHAREANKRLKKLGDDLVYVPALLEQGDETHMAGLAISLNEIRRDDDTLTKAEKCMRLLHRNGGDHKAAAVAFGVSVAAIKTWAKLAEVAPAVKRAVVAGEISASAAAELHGLDKEAQIAKLAKLVSTAKANGHKKATTAGAKRATGRRVSVPKRVLLKLVSDRELAASMPRDMVSGIKLALGTHLPGSSSKVGKLLTQAGYKYE